MINCKFQINHQSNHDRNIPATICRLKVKYKAFHGTLKILLIYFKTFDMSRDTIIYFLS